MSKIEVSLTRTKRPNLTTEEYELYELSKSAGLSWDPKVFKIILEMLRMKVSPMALEKVLKRMALLTNTSEITGQSRNTSINPSSPSKHSSFT